MEEKEEPNYQQIIDDEYQFPIFSEDPTEQNRLNVRHALKKAQSGMQLSEADSKLLNDNGFKPLNSGIAANDPLVDTLLLAAPFLAKPAILGGALTGLGNIIKKYPGKSFEVAATALGGASEDPQDVALETTAFKADTMFGGVRPTSIKKLMSAAEEILSQSPFAQTTDGINLPLFMSKSDDAQGISKKGFNPNITKKNLELFNQIGWTDTAKLDIQDMLYGIDENGKPLMSQYKRRVLKAGIGDETFNWSAFTKNRDEVVKDFLDGLQDLNIDPKTIHGHHISALRITSSLFDGLSPIQRKKLIKIFQREGLQLGNHPDNLMALHQSTHLDVVHPFLEQQIGKYGQLLIDPTKIKKMNPRQREGLVKKFAKIIKRSEEIAMENTRTWLDDAFEGMSPEAAFDARMDMLNKAFDDDIAFREQLLKSVKSEEPLLPYQAEDVEIPVTPKTKKTRVTSKQTKFKNLLKKIKTENPSWKQMTIWELSDDTLDEYRKLF
jgi:stress-induced morphogen